MLGTQLYVCAGLRRGVGQGPPRASAKELHVGVASWQRQQEEKELRPGKVQRGGGGCTNPSSRRVDASADKSKYNLALLGSRLGAQ